MRKNEYFKAELVRLLAFPIFLFLAYLFFVNNNMIDSSAAPIVWSIVLIEVTANLASLVAYYVLAGKK